MDGQTGLTDGASANHRRQTSMRAQTTANGVACCQSNEARAHVQRGGCFITLHRGRATHTHTHTYSSSIYLPFIYDPLNSKHHRRAQVTKRRKQASKPAVPRRPPHPNRPAPSPACLPACPPNVPLPMPHPRATYLPSSIHAGLASLLPRPPAA